MNNLGNKAKFGKDGSAYSQPMLIRLGAGYDFSFGKSVLGVSAEAAYLFGSEVIRNSLALTLGYSF